MRVAREAFQWELVDTDVPNYAVLELLIDLEKLGQRLVFVTGREEFLREKTEEFIFKHLGKKHTLFMRKNGDFRSDVEIKREIYNNHILGIFQVRFVLDDRDRVVTLWRHEFGLPTWQVADGSF